MVRSNKDLVAHFTDRYGTERIVHHTRHGLMVKRATVTVALALNQPISLYIGQRIKEERLAAGLTLEELCLRAGLAAAVPKARMWEIENSIRQQGLRMGTLYALAAALGVEATSLLPPVAIALELAEVAPMDIVTLALGVKKD